jgi:hypothetical protein
MSVGIEDTMIPSAQPWSLPPPSILPYEYQGYVLLIFGIAGLIGLLYMFYYMVKHPIDNK